MLTGNSSPGTTEQPALHLVVWGFLLGQRQVRHKLHGYVEE